MGGIGSKKKADITTPTKDKKAKRRKSKKETAANGETGIEEVGIQEKKDGADIAQNGPTAEKVPEAESSKKAETDSTGSGNAPTEIVQDSPDKETEKVGHLSDVQSPSEPSTSPVEESKADSSQTKVEAVKTEATVEPAQKDTEKSPTVDKPEDKTVASPESDKVVVPEEPVKAEEKALPETPEQTEKISPESKPPPIPSQPPPTHSEAPILVSKEILDAKSEPVSPVAQGTVSPVIATEPVSEPEIKAESVSAVTPEVVQETVVESKPEVEIETKPEAVIEVKPEAVVEAKPEVPVTSEAVVQPEAVVKAKSEVAVESTVETSAVNAEAVEIETVAEQKNEQVADAELKPVSEPVVTETKPEPISQPDLAVEEQPVASAPETVKEIAQTVTDLGAEQTSESPSVPEPVVEADKEGLKPQEASTQVVVEDVKPEKVEETANADATSEPVQSPECPTAPSVEAEKIEAVPETVEVHNAEQNGAVGDIPETCESTQKEDIKAAGESLAECNQSSPTAADEKLIVENEAIVNSPVSNHVEQVNGVQNGAATEETANSEVNGEVPSDIPTVIAWKHGGQEVAVCGDFTKWEDNCTLSNADGIFSTKIKLAVGQHHIKFLVDGKWAVDENAPVVELEGHGQVNLLIVEPSAE